MFTYQVVWIRALNCGTLLSRYTRSLFPVYLESQACEVDGRAEGQAGSEEGGQEDVAAVPGAPEALVGAVPGAGDAAEALGFADDVIPHHLEVKTDGIFK